MASRVCWACENKAVMEVRGYYSWTVGMSWEPGSDQNPYRVATLYECPECHLPSLGIVGTGSQYPDDWLAAAQGLQSQWIPVKALGKNFPDVPAHISSAADEAYQCLSINAYRAAVILARAVVEATCKAKGVTSGALYKKIMEMGNDGHLRPLAVSVAHEVRHIGNDMAHGDFVEDVTQEEAEDTLDLMSSILNEVFQEPARLTRVQTRRVQKGAGGWPS